MAILQTLPGIEVCICVNMIARPEYPDIDFQPKVACDILRQQEASNTVARYIESETGKQFLIKLKIKPSFIFDCPTVGFRIYVDGKLVREPIVRKAAFQENNYRWIHGIRGVKYAGNFGEYQHCLLHEFKFSEIQTSIDDERYDQRAEDAKVLSQVGEIVVKVFRRGDSQSVGPKVIQETVLDDYPSTVHEKALKGDPKSHGTSVGNGQATRFSKKWESELLDGEDHPIAIYRFKYRSRDALKALLVIREPPRVLFNPSPSVRANGPASRITTPALFQQNVLNLDSLSPADKLQILRILNREPLDAIPVADNERIEHQRTLDNQESPSSRVSARRQRQRRPQASMIDHIDLTEDDAVPSQEPRPQQAQGEIELINLCED